MAGSPAGNEEITIADIDEAIAVDLQSPTDGHGATAETQQPLGTCNLLLTTNQQQAFHVQGACMLDVCSIPSNLVLTANEQITPQIPCSNGPSSPMVRHDRRADEADLRGVRNKEFGPR